MTYWETLNWPPSESATWLFPPREISGPTTDRTQNLTPIFTWIYNTNIAIFLRLISILLQESQMPSCKPSGVTHLQSIKTKSFSRQSEQLRLEERPQLVTSSRCHSNTRSCLWRCRYSVTKRNVHCFFVFTARVVFDRLQGASIFINFFLLFPFFSTLLLLISICSRSRRLWRQLS